MILKEIKPGMVIHCKNDEEKKALLEEAEKLGYRWSGTANLPTSMAIDLGSTIHFYEKNEFTDFKHITWSEKTEGVTEFSDLILHEMTAEEALQIASEFCKNKSHCADCPILGNCYRDCDSDKGKVVEVLCKWKFDHEKKEPEIETEWFWQGRILKILEDGSYYQIKDGKCFYDTGCEFRESAEEYMEDELKEYCKTHDGKFIAVVEHVCRVKAVE